MSTSTPVCNHRIYEVLIVSLLAIVAGLVTGIFLTACGTHRLTATGSGAAVLAFVFTAGMTTVVYVKKRE
ncbi:hypothetical protein ACH4ZU_12080 [Streptomyces sp. NPDC020472]|uniref:hypothetical protein n=1 Tax=Streptomyces sp. NPDC020472 TaxID=3365075 RepID=UPI003792E7A1